MTNDHRPGQKQMFAWIDGLPEQLLATRQAPGLRDVAPVDREPRQILVCGMGGSAMAGSLLADGWPGLECPVFVHREPGLPAWAGPDTLVIACSYSGTTAETLDAVDEAGRRGCRLAAVTSGGRLLALARESGMPAVEVPGGQPPRTALGASFGAQLHLLSALGLLPDPTAEIEAACRQAVADELVCRDDDPAPVGEDTARELADELVDRFTVIHTAGAEAHGAGRRLLAQLNENAKAPGHVAVYPELCHNEIVGWELAPVQRAGYALITMSGQDAPASVRRAAEVTRGLLSEQFAVSTHLKAHGDSRLGRILGLILFGDLVSAHLAVARGVDPVPITRIDTLKSRLV